jgi:hypothetical protein
VNARQLPIHVDARADAELAALDDAQHNDAERQSLIHRRAEEINAARCGKLTLEDMSLAFELLSTFSNCLDCLRVEMLTDRPGFAAYQMSMIRAALLTDSMQQANDEFANLDALKTGEVH